MRRLLLVGINSRYYQISQSIRSLKKNSAPFADILELNSNDNVLDHLDRLLKKRYEIYAFSVYIWNYDLIRDLCISLKELLPDCRIILGGPEITCSEREKIIKEFQCDDLVVGEGETALKKILAGNNEIEKSCYERDLSEISLPDADDVSDSRISFRYTETCRGCPFKCSYCTSGDSTPVRYHELKKVKNNILSLSSSGIDTLRFIDRTFNTDENRAVEIMRFIIDMCPDILYQFEVRADIMSDSFIHFLRNVPENKFQLEIGVQTLNPESIRKVSRNEDQKRLMKSLCYLISGDNLLIHLDIIAGLPEDDIERVRFTVDTLVKMFPHILQLNILKILPGTTLKRDCNDFDMIYLKEPPYTLLKSNTFSYDDLRELDDVSKTINLFYNSRFLKKTLKYLIEKNDIRPYFFFLGLRGYLKQEYGRIHSLSRRNIYTVFRLYLRSIDLYDETVERFLRIDHILSSSDPKERFPENKRKDNKMNKKDDVKDKFHLNMEKNVRFKMTKTVKKLFYPENDRGIDDEDVFFYFSSDRKRYLIVEDALTIRILKMIYDKKTILMDDLSRESGIDKKRIISAISTMLEYGMLRIV